MPSASLIASVPDHCEHRFSHLDFLIYDRSSRTFTLTWLDPTLHTAIRISCDRGGTFLDCWASWKVEGEKERKEKVFKLLSSDPSNYEDAPTEACRRVLEYVTGNPYPRGVKLPTEKIEYIRLSTTVATNALLERKGARHAFVVTKGFRDLLRIGNQSRPDIFALNIQRPEVLFDEVLE